MNKEHRNVKIICVGSRLTSMDSPGPMVYDYLVDMTLPADVQVIDAGLTGLDLIRCIDGATQLIFVDSACGFKPTLEVLVLTLEEVIKNTDCNSYNHASGLVYLFHVIPEIYKDQLPAIYFVGIQGIPRTDLIKKAAETSLQLAAGTP